MSLFDNVSSRPRNPNSAHQKREAEKVMEYHSRYVEKSYYDNVSDKRRVAPTSRPTAWLEDGVDHINLWHAGRTQAGKILDINYYFNWNHPVIGRFISVAAFAQHIMSKTVDNRVRMMRNYELNQYARYQRENERIDRLPMHQVLVLQAMYLRLTAMDNVVEILNEGKHLPLDQYNIRTQSGETVRAAMSSWFVPGMEIVRSAILAGKNPDFSEFSPYIRSVYEEFSELRPQLLKSAKSVKPKVNAEMKEQPIREKKEPLSVVDKELADEQARNGSNKAFEERKASLDNGTCLISLTEKYPTREARVAAMMHISQISPREVEEIIKIIIETPEDKSSEENIFQLNVEVRKDKGGKFVVMSTGTFVNPYAEEQFEYFELLIEDEGDPREAIHQVTGCPYEHITQRKFAKKMKADKV